MANKTSNGLDSPADVKATYHVLNRIRDAWESGRQIVPIIGAGFSADSGFPILNSICRYLARFKFGLDEGLLLPKFGAEVAPKLDKKIREVIEEAKESPIKYIKLFAWPDRFDLNQMVTRHIIGAPPRVGAGPEDPPLETQHQMIEHAISKQFAWLAQKSTTARAAEHWKRLERPRRDAEWLQWAIQGDWRRLIQFFTDYQADFADALFAKFGFQRTPGAGHRYMSLLAKLLPIRRIFTFNFDDLIEASLVLEGIPHRVYGMEHGRTLPSEGVLDERVAVIKMHGSHHSILIDEKLDRPLNDDYIDRFYSLAGRDALLLVIGCSGDDRRLKDLLAARRDGGRTAEVCWVHFETVSPVPEEVRRVGPDSLIECPTNNPAAFVRHVVFYLSGRFPTSPHPYPSHSLTPTLFGKPGKEAANKLRETPELDDYSYRSKLEDIEQTEELLILGGAAINSQFVPIWVDVEAAHTPAGIIGAIIDGCRRNDPELPPAVMPLGGFDEQKGRALARLTQALQRHRYVVLVDGVNTYGSSPLMHHSSSDETKAEEEAKKFGQFLEELSLQPIGQSIIVASTAGHAKRRDPVVPPPGDLLEMKFKEFELMDGPPLLWACLAAHRRTRPLPSLRRLLAPMVHCADNDEIHADAFLRKLAVEQKECFRLLEGGDVWFVRGPRDKVYTNATRFTGSRVFKALATDESGLRPCALAQSTLMYLLHGKIASTYFSFDFMQSRDAGCFLEYTYHRVSSVRYLSRAIYLLLNYRDAWPGAWLMLDGFVRDLPARRVAHGFSPEQYFGKFWAELAGQDVAVLVEALRDRRICELEALRASWVEFEQTIRVQIPAEQLLLWSEEIVKGECIGRLSGAYVGDALEPDDDRGRSSRKCEEIRRYFLRLQVRINLERGDFRRAQESLRHATAGDDDGLDALLDHVECSMRTREVEHAAELLRKVEAAHESDLTGERLHRYHHMQGLLHLGVTPYVEADVMDGVLSVPGADPTKARGWAERGIAGIRGPGALLASPLEGLVVSTGSPGGAYRPYRSTFRTLKGRAIVAELLRSNLGGTTRDSDLSAFRRAMRQFDQAKGDLDPQHALLKAWADLHAAESTLLFIRRTFDRAGAFWGADDEQELCFSTIQAKLLSCRTQLLGGIDALMSGRRNAVWWRHCVQLIAQYHTERLFVDLCELHQGNQDARAGAGGKPEGSTRPRGSLLKCGADLLRRYGRALEAVTAFVHFSIDRDSALGNVWFQRTLAEVHLGAAAAASVYEFGDAPPAVKVKAIAEAILTHSKNNYPQAMGDSPDVIGDRVKRSIDQMRWPTDSRVGLRNDVVRAVRSTTS